MAQVNRFCVFKTESIYNLIQRKGKKQTNKAVSMIPISIKFPIIEAISFKITWENDLLAAYLSITSNIY